MRTNLPQGLYEQFLLPTWVLDRVMSANFRLSSYLINAMAVSPDFAGVYMAEQEALKRLRDDHEQAAIVFCTPFLAFAPSLSTPEDWKCFIEGTTPTVALDRVQAQLPELTVMDTMLLEQGNRSYVGALYDVLNMSPLAAPLLGISNELADYLRSVPQHTLDLAISERRLPLFRWRIVNKLFWFEAGAGKLTREIVAHYLMDLAPMRADRLPHSAPWGNFRLPRYLVEAYSEAFIRLRCRAKSVAALFNVNTTAIRQMYAQIHGESSPSGQPPASAMWYLESAGRRVQATFQIWLFRCALSVDTTIAEAFISAMDVSGRVFGATSKVPPERAFHLARSMATEDELAIRPCRSCGTAYLASNSAMKIELSHSFLCPCCTGTLSATNAAKGRRGGRKL